MTLVVIALGSNIEAPTKRLLAAFACLNEVPGLSGIKASSIYQSPPMGPKDQPPFFNAVISGDYTGDPMALLTALQHIEKAMGRVKRRHWGERCIDLDIIQFGQSVIDLPTLTVPHPGLKHRLFVVQPMIDVLGSDHRVPGLPELGTLRNKLSDEFLTLCSDTVLG